MMKFEIIAGGIADRKDTTRPDLQPRSCLRCGAQLWLSKTAWESWPGVCATCWRELTLLERNTMQTLLNILRRLDAIEDKVQC